MDAVTADRLDRLEARLATLEALVGLRPAPVAAPVAAPPVPPPVPWPAAPVAPPIVTPIIPPSGGSPPPGIARDAVPVAAPASRPGRPGFDYERFFGLAVLGRVGIAAVVLAAAWFAQLGWGHLSPGLRVLVIYAGGIAFVVAGHLLRARVAPRYVAMLWGGGTALTYLAGVAARLRYELIDVGPALLLLVASAALGQLLARTLRLQAMATIALAGAFAAPVLVGHPSAQPTAFYAYLLALHGWAAWTEHRWQWSWARGLAVAATAVLALAWLVGNPPLPALSLVLHVEAILLGLGAPELIAAFRGREPGAMRWQLWLPGAWLVQLALLGQTLGQDALRGFGLAAGAAGLGGAALLAPRAAALRAHAGGLARLGGVLLAIGAVVAWNARSGPGAPAFDQPWQRLGSVVAAGALLLAVRRWTVAGELGAGTAAILGAVLVLGQGAPSPATRWQTGLALLVPAALAVLGRVGLARAAGLGIGAVLAFFGLCQDWRFAGPGAFWLPIAFGAAGGWCALGALLAGWRRDRTLLGTAALLLGALGVGWCGIAFAPAATADGGGLPPFANLRFLTAVALLALLELGRRRLPGPAGQVEHAVFVAVMLALGYVAGLVETLDLVRDWPHGWSAVTVSLYTLVFAGALLVAGFVRQQRWLRWPGLAGFAFVVGKVALYDLSGLDTPLRVLLTGALGLVLLLGAWLYARVRVAEPSPR